MAVIIYVELTGESTNKIGIRRTAKGISSMFISTISQCVSEIPHCCWIIYSSTLAWTVVKATR